MSVTTFVVGQISFQSSLTLKQNVSKMTYI